MDRQVQEGHIPLRQIDDPGNWGPTVFILIGRLLLVLFRGKQGRQLGLFHNLYPRLFIDSGQDSDFHYNELVRLIKLI